MPIRGAFNLPWSTAWPVDRGGKPSDADAREKLARRLQQRTEKALMQCIEVVAPNATAWPVARGAINDETAQGLL